MPLTPEDVRNKQFTTVRLREGYDEDEVDAFLDKVEVELTRLVRENKDLRAKLAAATRPTAQSQRNTDEPPGQDQQQGSRGPSDARSSALGPPQQMDGPSQLPSGVLQLPAGPSSQAGEMGQGPMGGQMGGPSGDSAARVLSMAQRTADQAIAEARSEANKIVGEARARAAGLERDARSRADALERDAQEKHRVALSSLESARATLEHKVEDLRGFERDYRTRLRSYLESQLRHLEIPADDSPPPPRPPATASLPPSMGPAGASGPPYGANPTPSAPAYGGQHHMPPAMSQPMAPIRPPGPSPMRGYLIDDDDN
ncbi:DivIVA domain-containing protein [Streptomyces sp. AK02-04a]|uniref:DivIVA domain-containing protein n=1 Tax=Streptomyces sp. AK02-04a TaxID=3028649 RepID=UPI0029AF8C47|nr:DivIVA domain-containing protein [Streptomyces sp. AK02-04a]MDX3762774.1 DivIVA domain-containing protein [Streptomyces sp. AK02-04a]